MKKYNVVNDGLKLVLAVCLVAGMLLCSAPVFAATVVTEAGYSFVNDEDVPGRAAEYQSLDSSPYFNVDAQIGTGEKHIDVEVDYKNEHDYQVTTHFDVLSVLRVNMRLEKMFHNLDHIPYRTGTLDARDPAVSYNSPLVTNPYSVAETRVDYTDYNFDDEYSLAAETFQMDVRYKVPDIPAHINLGYWRYEKDGSKQLRFMDENCAAACHLQSRTRKLDRVTNEFTVSADGHFGLLDLVVGYLYRDFKDQLDTPRNFYNSITGRRNAGIAEHSEDPDSKMQEATLATHTSLAGGFVANASWTLGQRENKSELNDVSPVEAELDYQKFSGDLVFTPADKLRMVLRLRQLTMDFSNSDTITSTLMPVATPVRENLDLKEKIVELISTWRLNRNVQMKALLKRSETGRDNVGSTPGTTWQLPEKEVRSIFTLGSYYRSLSKRRIVINTTYRFEKNSTPAYTTSSYNKHELFVSTSFKPGQTWGVNASARAGLDRANTDESYLISSGVYAFERNREKQQQNFNLGVWTIPAQQVNLSFNYGFFRTDITQDILFGDDAEPPGADWSGLTSPQNIESGHTFLDQDVEFLQQVHMLTANLGLQLSKAINVHLSGRYTRAKAEYSPHFSYQEADTLLGNEGMDYLATSDGLSDLGRVDLVQTGAELGIDWHALERLRLSAELNFASYNDKNMSVYDGSVTRSMLSMAYSW